MTKLHRTLKIIVLALTVFGASQCGGGESIRSSFSDNQTSGSDGDFETPFGDAISEIALEVGDNVIDLSGQDVDGDVVLVLFSSDEGNSQHGFGLGSSLSDEVSESKFLQESFENDDGDITESFHAQLREAEAAVEDEMVDVPSPSLSYAVKTLSVGDEQGFRVLNSFSSSSSYTSVTAELLLQTDYFNIFVDVRDVSSFSYAEIEQIADDFLSVIEKEREIFGTESDVNGDGRFDILFTRVVNELGGSQGGIVTGFFYAMDLFESAKFPVSNEKEIIFVMVPDPEGEHGSAVSNSFAINNIIKGVLPHEYQHMINFNRHYFQNAGLAEKSWLNEGLSHLAEDLHSLNGDEITGFGLENPARVSSYLSSISNTCFTCGTGLAHRGGSYLLLKYLYGQAQNLEFPGVNGGADMIQKLLNTDLRGVENIMHVLYGPEETDANFRDVMGLFALAIYFSDTGLSDDSRFQFEGFDLRGAVSDNRGTFLNGPSIQTISAFPFVDSLQGTGITYVKIPNELLQERDGRIDLSVSESTDFGGFLIR